MGPLISQRNNEMPQPKTRTPEQASMGPLISQRNNLAKCW